MFPKKARTITTMLELGDGYVSYCQKRSTGKTLITLRQNGKLLGCLTNSQVSHDVAARMLLQMAKHGSTVIDESDDSTVSPDAAEWNDQQV